MLLWFAYATPVVADAVAVCGWGGEIGHVLAYAGECTPATFIALPKKSTAIKYQAKAECEAMATSLKRALNKPERNRIFCVAEIKNSNYEFFGVARRKE
jgi:hypothetical protein